ncbi:MAG: iron chelate uptake ABC transporter family permease subunit [Pseudomonadota bacterium]|nr:iron chelate uptake ABC transporter family permease subunit [Pseudomonadota bacterium]
MLTADIGWKFGALAVLACGAVAVFLLLGVPAGAWEFALAFRGFKLLALVLVAYAVSTSTILFHTVTRNQILTPSIMGFDALYLLIQTLLVFLLGGWGMLQLDGIGKFGAEVACMMLFSTMLFLWLFNRNSRNLHLMILVGIIFGILFRSLAGFAARLIDPNDFVVVQGAQFATFNAVNTDLLWISLALCGGTMPLVWRLRHALDVLTLGRDPAINLGLPYHGLVLAVLAIVALLVSVSTALVGPVSFFGLLVAHLAYMTMPRGGHGATLIAGALIAMLVLIGGQAVFEHVLGLKSALSIVIDFIGGLVFLFLLLRGHAR